jgi:hypothetical protein
MSIQRVKKRMADGSVKIYEYQPRSYYVKEIDRARAFLRKWPLKAVPAPRGGGVVWVGGLRKTTRKARNCPVFRDITIMKLIAEGYAICHGNFVELKGIQR